MPRDEFNRTKVNKYCKIDLNGNLILYSCLLSKQYSIQTLSVNHYCEAAKQLTRTKCNY